MILRGLAVLLIFGLCQTVVAAEEDEKPNPLSGSVKLGFLSTTGNTETSSLNTGFDATYKINRWEHIASASAVRSSENKVTNAEAYDAGWRSRWDLTKTDFLFGRLEWRKDRFGAFDTQFSQTLGYGRRVLNTDAHRLNAELGAGARQSEDQFGVNQDETILFGGLDYRWNFSETAEFRQDFTIESGDKNTYFESVSAISATLIGSVSLVASYTIRNNSTVPLGSEKTDTRTAIALEYGF